MPITRREFVPLPFAERRHTPDSSRLASLYLRGGEILSDLSLRKGEIAARTMGTLQQLFSNYQDIGRRKKAAEVEQTIRKAERESERAEREAERKARAEELKTAREDRKYEQDRGAARYAADSTAPGPISPVLADALRRFPETAGRLRDTTTLPARAMPGTAPISAEPEAFTALEPNAEQLERSAERVSREKLARDTAAAAATERAIDNARQAKALSLQEQYQNRSLAIQQQNANTTAANSQARLGIIGGNEKLTANYRNALERVLSNTPANRRGPKIAHAARLFEEGNEPELKDFIRQNAIEGENVDTKNQVLGRMATIASLKDTTAILQELKAKGVDTNILTGTMEDLYRKLGTTTDPELVALRNRLAGTLINYRRAATGVAFGEKEGAQYEKMFPNYKNTLPVNEALITGLMREMETYDRVYWTHKLGAEGAALILGSGAAGAPRILSIVPVPRPQ